MGLSSVSPGSAVFFFFSSFFASVLGAEERREECRFPGSLCNWRLASKDVLFIIGGKLMQFDKESSGRYFIIGKT
jgi:hypothetical protein